MARREEYLSAVTIRRSVNGFSLVAGEGLERRYSEYVANDYAHLIEILKELLGPVENYPEHTHTYTKFVDDDGTTFSL